MTSKSFLKSMRKLGLMGTLVFVGLLAPNLAQAQLVVDGGNTLSVPPDIINSIIVGDTGQGTLNQTGGTVKGSIILGNQATGNGTYKLSAGTLRDVNDFPILNSITVGNAGQGTFNQTGGGVSANNLTLGSQATGIGTYNLSGTGSSLYVSMGSSIYYTGSEVIGGNGTGIFTMNGGGNTADNLSVGSGGTYTQIDGTTSVFKNFYMNGTYELRSGNLDVNSSVGAGEWIGQSGPASFIQTGGSHSVGYYGLTLGSSSTYTLSGNGSLRVGYNGSGDLIINGTFTQSGGSVITDAGFGFGSLYVGGTYNLEGGTLSTARSLSVGGSFNLTGVTLNLHAGLGAYNGGAVKTTNANITWNVGGGNGFENSGAYISNQSSQTFTNLKVDATGYIVAASQDTFNISGNFQNQSNQNTLWNTAGAKLSFITGQSGDHNLYIPGGDTGPGGTNAFAWNTLDLSGQILHLFDGDAAASGALYVKNILGVSFTDLLVSNILMGQGGLNLNIYYDPTTSEDVYLQGLTYNLTGGGQLIPTLTPFPIIIGTVTVTNDAQLGPPSGGLFFNGGTLQTAADFTSARSITLLSNGGTWDTEEFISILSGVISGPGALTKTGVGTLILTGINAYGGGTLLKAGILKVSQDANLGAATGPVTFNGGTLQAAGALTTSRNLTVLDNGGTFDTGTFASVFSGELSGSGTFTQQGTGSLTLMGDGSPFSGTYAVTGGTLTLNNALGSNLSPCSLVIKPGSSWSGNGTLVGSLDLRGDGSGFSRRPRGALRQHL